LVGATICGPDLAAVTQPSSGYLASLRCTN
jgi:hypothetical protein